MKIYKGLEERAMVAQREQQSLAQRAINKRGFDYKTAYYIVKGNRRSTNIMGRRKPFENTHHVHIPTHSTKWNWMKYLSPWCCCTTKLFNLTLLSTTVSICYSFWIQLHLSDSRREYIIRTTYNRIEIYLHIFRDYTRDTRSYDDQATLSAERVRR